MKKKLITMAILVFVASMVIAVAPASAQNGTPGFAWVRVAHASPDAPNVDVWVNGAVAISDLAFGDVTDYLLVPDPVGQVPYWLFDEILLCAAQDGCFGLRLLSRQPVV